MIKQSIIVRTDLGMSVGKIAGQVAHASQEFLREHYMKFCSSRYPVSLSTDEHDWLFGDRVKIVLSASSEQELLDLKAKCDSKGVKAYFIRDLGKTEIAADTLTTLAIGPDQGLLVDEVTNGLKLLR